MSFKFCFYIILLHIMHTHTRLIRVSLIFNWYQSLVHFEKIYLLSVILFDF
jgi:hypothetical protein